jgi:hypothetical protein
MLRVFCHDGQPNPTKNLRNPFIYLIRNTDKKNNKKIPHKKIKNVPLQREPLRNVLVTISDQDIAQDIYLPVNG